MSLDMGMFLVLLVATLLMLAISYLSYRKQNQPVAKYFAWIMLSSSFYSLGYAFEMISVNLEQGKFWLKVQHLGIPFISTLWLMLAATFAGHQAYLKRWVITLLFIIPVVTLLLQFTNDSHHLYYRDVLFDPSNPSLSSIVLVKGPFYWLHIAYLYLEAALGIALLARMYWKAVPIVRRQVAMLVFGASAPWLSNIVYLAAYQQVKLDLTPFGFTVTGLVCIFGIYRFHLLRLVPIAYQKVFDTMQDGVVILDYEHHLSHVNEAAKGLFPELKTWNGQTFSIDTLFRSQPDLLAMVAASSPVEHRVSIQPEEDDTRHYHVKMSIMYDQADIVLGKLIIFSDVTQSVLYQEQLHENRNQLADLNDFKDTLFAVVAHDIRDPLALLVNLTEIIEEDFIDSGSEESEIFREISGQVRDTHLLVENVLDWVRSQRGKILFHPLSWELEPIVRATVHSMKLRLEAKRIRLTVSVQEDARMYADKDMVELTLRNLLFNAMKYTEMDGHIHVEAAGNSDQVTISVKDSGIGVNEEIGKSLFREIQQGSSPDTDGIRGTGLGLYLCGKFVRLNGGDIGYTSRPGQGSSFFFTLPSAESNVRRRTWKEADAL